MTQTEVHTPPSPNEEEVGGEEESDELKTAKAAEVKTTTTTVVQEEIPVVDEEGVEYVDEFDEVKERRNRRMPIVYSYAGPEIQHDIAQKLHVRIKTRPTIQHVTKTQDFKILDMHIKDALESMVIGSFAIYHIAPHKQILPMEISSIPGVKVKKNIWYEVISGKGLLSIDDYTEPVIANDLILLEQDVKHNFFNTGDEILIIKMMYDGHMDLRDRYTPSRKISQEARISREKFFNASTQQTEERVVRVPVPSTSKTQQAQRTPQVRRFQVTDQSSATMGIPQSTANEQNSQKMQQTPDQLLKRTKSGKKFV
jgi:mannose-6-phosphate isomerase-like protein (cupin superfamily)